MGDLFSSGTLAIEPGLPYAAYLKKKYGFDKVKIVPYDGGVARFVADKNFAQQCFIGAEPIAAKKQGADPQIFMLSDEGFNPYSVIVVVRQKLWQENAERVRAFRRAVALEEGEDVGGLLVGDAGVLVDDLAAFDDVALARRETGARLAEGLDDFLVGVGQQREGKVVEFLELLLLFHRVDTHADDSGAVLLQFRGGVASRLGERLEHARDRAGRHAEVGRQFARRDPRGPRPLPDLQRRLEIVLHGQAGHGDPLCVRPMCVRRRIGTGGPFYGPPARGESCRRVDRAAARPAAAVFHAGTRAADGRIETAGGRVLTVVGRADGFDRAMAEAYAAVDLIHFDGMQFRRDIGRKAVAMHHASSHR